MTTSDSIHLETGDPAPAFSGLDDTNTVRSSDEFAGKKLIIYFYPKAFTPGCTTESCDFRDRYDVLAERGYEILGVSPDGVEKLGDFRAHNELPFHLLSDPDHDVASAFGAYGTKKNYGREYQGIIRSTFLIGADGMIEEAYYNVRAKGHADRVAGAVTS